MQLLSVSVRQTLDYIQEVIIRDLHLLEGPPRRLEAPAMAQITGLMDVAARLRSGLIEAGEPDPGDMQTRIDIAIS